MAREPTSMRTVCPMERTLGVIGGKWKSTILCKLAMYGPMRYNVLLKEVHPISSRILSKQLKEMEGDGIIRREEVPPNVFYSVTPRGESLLPVLKALVEWAVSDSPAHIINIEDLSGKF